eukprot:CAMPEP_0119124638 /NCGR_PEP_ID=MMETSP1310-20130426/4205_1 /TAXON_ID=464262 /ORGANISM="Genus nov. species nov., Strain RCC2339" /LENGTH=72 /DNA_ID=CAMNT_0007114625 /DNA_START=601 /DNA_END=819 /DNA_ORIENTATION=-
MKNDWEIFWLILQDANQVVEEIAQREVHGEPDPVAVESCVVRGRKLRYGDILHGCAPQKGQHGRDGHNTVDV